MKYRILVLWYEDEDGYCNEVLFVNGNRRRYAYPMWDCPEDATIERGLIGCSDIASYMKEAFEACKSGEYTDVEYKGIWG